MNFNKIVFFHGHVNGDCFQSRIIVNHIINITKHLNIEYCYTATRALSSHSLDLNILDENFNKYSVENYNSPCYIKDNILYIHVWIGLYNILKCTLCLKDIIKNYNLLIQEINNITDLNITFIPEDTYPYLNFNYSYYDCNFLQNFINNNKKVYSKIILIFNLVPSTFYSLSFDHSFYLNKLAIKYPNYLFITFNDQNLNYKNIISIKKIYDLNNKDLPISFGIQFSYLSLLADKVLLLPTGPSLFCVNNNNIQNKFLIFLDIGTNKNPYNTVHCQDINYHDKLLCTSKFNWNINVLKLNSDAFDHNYITNYIDDFIVN